MISSTVTRPTSIAATATCDQKISLVETVDIGPMLPPKPRTISLEPISRRTRRVRTIKNKDNGVQGLKDVKEVSTGSQTTRDAGSPMPDESASQCGSTDHPNPRSPVPIDVQSSVSAANSADSTTSSTSFRVAATSARSTKDSQQSNEKAPLSEKTITATIELLKAGCLPGESLPLKISIKHTKAIKSMHGIIITLYRQGRIDSAPPLSLFVDIKGKEAERLKHEEYYPKSKTGLGGLSLTSAGSSSLFRKDLAQIFAPILVDPTTFTSVVNASVRVPEDAFPTIVGVPGQMISFKYHIEVVIDLGGKLAGQERHIPTVGTLSLPTNFANTPGRADPNSNMLSAWGGSIVDTDSIRREKSVVVCVFDITVGTTDSARKRGRGNNTLTRKATDYEAAPAPPVIPPTHEPIYEEEPASMMINGYDHHGYDTNGYDVNGCHYTQQPYDYYDENNNQEYYDENHNYHHHYSDHPPPSPHTEIHVPPPEIRAEEHLSDKDRVRRAEERLLPSQPPQESFASSSSSAPLPSALAPHPEEDLYGPDDEDTPISRPNASRSFSNHHHPPPFEPHLNHPSAPPLSELTNNNNTTPTPTANLRLPSAPPPSTNATEDKQELERRRMLAEASAPEEIPDENAGEGSSALRNGGRTEEHVASAPVLVDEEYGESVGGGGGRRESLPRYER